MSGSGWVSGSPSRNDSEKQDWGGGAAGKEESSRKGHCWSGPCYGHYPGPPKDP